MPRNTQRERYISCVHCAQFLQIKEGIDNDNSASTQHVLRVMVLIKGIVKQLVK